MPRILVLDDDPAISHLYARWLGDAHQVVALGDAAEAMARFQAGERYDAVVCDVHMPGLSGFELHAAIERLDPAQARRIVFVTAGPVRVGARAPSPSNPLLFKPFGIEELRQAVEGVLPGAATTG